MSEQLLKEIIHSCGMHQGNRFGKVKLFMYVYQSNRDKNNGTRTP